MKKIVFILYVSTLIFACNSKKETGGKSETLVEKYETTGSIERLDPAIDQIIPSDAVLEIIGEGFNWSEGPVWISKGNYLLFSDVPENKVFKWKEGEGVTQYLSPSGYTGDLPRSGEGGSNGLLLDRDGNLILCQHGDRRLARMNADLDDPKADFITVAGLWKEKKFNSPNDAVYNKKGDLYFTDPPYGLPGMENNPTKEIDFEGVFRLTASGQVELLTKELNRPNGIAFSPDEKKLYVANSDPAQALWMVYNLSEDGLIESGKVLYDATEWVPKGKGLPDGLKVDRNGNVFATGPGGIWVFDPEGRLLGKIKTGQATANCAFSNDQKVLYITADMYLMRLLL